MRRGGDRRPAAPPARPVWSGGGGGPPVGEQGACRTVSIGLQVLVGAGAGAWAAEGAGLRAAGSRTERGLRSGRSTSRRRRRSRSRSRSPKPRASCSRRRCASPGPPRRQGPRVRPPPAPRGLPGLGRSQVRSRSSSRGPGAPGPAFPRGPSRTPSPGAPNPPPSSPKAFPKGPARHGVGTSQELGLEGGGGWNPLCAPAGGGAGARCSVLGLASREEVRIAYLSLVNPGPRASIHFLTNCLREREGVGKALEPSFWRQVCALTSQSKAIVPFCKLFVRLVTILGFVFNS